MGKATLSNRLYRIYQNMKGRCTRPYNTSYRLYGARGIKVCDEWMVKGGIGFRLFEKWALENGYCEDLTIDRIDTNGDYEPQNCRWVTTKEQNRNKRNNVYVDGCVLKDYAEKHGINAKTIGYRIKVGNDLIEPKNKKRFINLNGYSYRPIEFSKTYGFNINGLQTAINRGNAKKYIFRHAADTSLDVGIIKTLEIEERG